MKLYGNMHCGDWTCTMHAETETIKKYKTFMQQQNFTLKQWTLKNKNEKKWGSSNSKPLTRKRALANWDNHFFFFIIRNYKNSRQAKTSSRITVFNSCICTCKSFSQNPSSVRHDFTGAKICFLSVGGGVDTHVSALRHDLFQQNHSQNWLHLLDRRLRSATCVRTPDHACSHAIQRTRIRRVTSLLHQY